MLLRLNSCLRFGSMLIVAASLTGCQKEPSPAAPSATLTAAPGGMAVGLDSRDGRHEGTITLSDACDPESFNAALGPGTCTRSGGVSFDNFLEQLRKHQSVGAWHFTPPQLTLAVGGTLIAMNHGGETHTFTEVEDFGGGIVPLLNQLAGTPNVAPECAQLQSGDFLAPGMSSRETEDEEGVEKYQCCIHPWMRAEVRIGKH
jgi:plastocyanin